MEGLKVKDIFEDEKSYAGKYPAWLIRYMKRDLLRNLSISTDPHEQGQYVRDRSWLWHIYKNFDKASYIRTKTHIVRHEDSIDFKDDAGLEQEKLSRYNIKLPQGTEFDESEHQVLGGHHLFTHQSIEKLLSNLPPITMGTNKYRAELLGARNFKKVILPLMPGDSEKVQLDNFAKLMRLQPLGYAKGDVSYSSLYGNYKAPPPAPEPKVDPDDERSVRRSSRVSRKDSKHPLEEPHSRYLLDNDLPPSSSMQKNGMIPYLVAGPSLNGVIWLPPTDKILVPVRCALRKID